METCLFSLISLVAYVKFGLYLYHTYIKQNFRVQIMLHYAAIYHLWDLAKTYILQCHPGPMESEYVF